MVTNQSQLQQDINTIDKAAGTAILAFRSAAFALNHYYDALWNLLKPRLLGVLQTIHNDSTLTDVFLRHNSAAAAVNAILGLEAAKIAVPRVIVITDDVVSFSAGESATPTAEEILEG